jgi:uncharacterized protein involved in exopolysaccharide biosynthesis
MLANVSKDYVFDIIDRPVVAESAAKPQRLLICGLGAMGGMLLGLLVVLIHSYSRSWTLKV